MRQLLRSRLDEAYADVTITFDTPDETFPSAAVALPAINLFLFDIHENHLLRDPTPRVTREGDTWKRNYPPVRVDFHYLATAWTGEDDTDGEHRLLGAVMKALLRWRYVPAELIVEELPEQPMAVRAFALQSESLGASSDFWRALGSKPRASLRFTITVAVEAFPAIEVPPPPESVVVEMGDTQR
ncbi:MAG: DUF4255 domain-containing protein [bacterium]